MIVCECSTTTNKTHPPLSYIFDIPCRVWSCAAGWATATRQSATPNATPDVTNLGAHTPASLHATQAPQNPGKIRNLARACSCSKQGPRRFGRVTQRVVSTLVSRIVWGVRVGYSHHPIRTPVPTNAGRPRPGGLPAAKSHSPGPAHDAFDCHLRSTVSPLLHYARHLGSRKLSSRKRSSNRRSAKPERTLGGWV